MTVTNVNVEERTIEDAFLEEGDNLVLTILNSRDREDSVQNARVRVGDAYFFKVQNVLETFTYGPQRQVQPDGTNFGTLGSGSGRDYEVLRRAEDGKGSAGDPLMENEELEWLIHHFSVSVAQPYMRIYPQVPNVERMGGFEWQTATQPDPANGDQWGSIAGSEMPYFRRPPLELENVSFMDFEDNFAYGFFNESNNKDAAPLLYVKGQSYNVIPITNTERKRSIYKRNEGPPAHRVSLGPVFRSFDIQTPTEWNNAGNALTVRGNDLTEPGGV